MINRVTVPLEQPEYSALLAMAVTELRNPPDQLRHILRQELKRRRLLQDETGQKGGDQNELPVGSRLVYHITVGLAKGPQA